MGAALRSIRQLSYLFLRICHRAEGVSENMGLLDLAAKGWGKNYWYELTFNEKGFTIFIIFDLIVVSPLIILDILDSTGLI